jgi:ABC-type transport system substrate-binding protein
LNLRLAINYALDGTQLAQASGVNDFITASTLGNAKYPDYVADVETEDNYYHVQDLELAKEYLDKSSYKGETLTIAMNNGADLVNIGTAIQAMLLQIGINVDIDAEDSTIIDTKQVNGEYDLYLTKMAADDYMPIVWYRWFSDDFHSVSHTVCNCDDDTLRDLLSACIVTGGNTPENMMAFHDYVVENAYGYGLFSNCVSDVVSNEITEPCWNYQDFIVPGGCIYADNEF